jgi:mannose-6-phosphate isomerase-like protein (cupin superfamily)
LPLRGQERVQQHGNRGENTMRSFKRFGLAGLTLLLAAGWSYRELAYAFDGPKELSSTTINLDAVKMVTTIDRGEPVGLNGVYLAGDTPASTKFATGRFVLPAGKTPHAPHTHAEEEIMIVESGHGEILCDGKTTKVGPGSVMYTVPNASHGITNTSDEPIVFYYVKWESRK